MLKEPNVAYPMSLCPRCAADNWKWDDITDSWLCKDCDAVFSEVVVLDWSALYDLARELYPRGDKFIVKRLVHLLVEKGYGMRFISGCASREMLDNLLGSVLRHQNTHYDQLLRSGVNKEDARQMVGSMVSNDLNYYKGK